MGTVFEVKKEIPGKMLSRFAIAILLTAISLSPVTAQVRGSASGPMGVIVTPGTMGTGTAATGTSGFGIAAISPLPTVLDYCQTPSRGELPGL